MTHEAESKMLNYEYQSMVEPVNTTAMIDGRFESDAGSTGVCETKCVRACFGFSSHTPHVLDIAYFYRTDNLPFPQDTLLILSK